MKTKQTFRIEEKDGKKHLKWEAPSETGSSSITEYVVSCSAPQRDGNTANAIIFRGLANECEWKDGNTQVIYDSSAAAASSSSASSSSQPTPSTNTIFSQLLMNSTLDEQRNAIVSICVTCFNGEGLESCHSDPFIIPIPVRVSIPICGLHWDSTPIGNSMSLSTDHLSVVGKGGGWNNSSAFGNVAVNKGGPHSWTLAITASTTSYDVAFGIAPQFDPVSHSALSRGWSWSNNGSSLAQSSKVSGNFDSSLFQSSPTMMRLQYDNITGILSATHFPSGTTQTISNINAANTKNEEIFPFVNVHRAGNKVEIVSESK